MTTSMSSEATITMCSKSFDNQTQLDLIPFTPSPPPENWPIFVQLRNTQAAAINMSGGMDWQKVLEEDLHTPWEHYKGPSNELSKIQGHLKNIRVLVASHVRNQQLGVYLRKVELPQPPIECPILFPRRLMAKIYDASQFGLSAINAQFNPVKCAQAAFSCESYAYSRLAIAGFARAPQFYGSYFTWVQEPGEEKARPIYVILMGLIEGQNLLQVPASSLMFAKAMRLYLDVHLAGVNHSDPALRNFVWGKEVRAEGSGSESDLFLVDFETAQVYSEPSSTLHCSDVLDDDSILGHATKQGLIGFFKMAEWVPLGLSVKEEKKLLLDILQAHPVPKVEDEDEPADFDTEE